MDEVGGIHSTPHARFDDSPVHLLTAEMEQSHGRGEFEKGWVSGFWLGLINSLIKGYHLIIGYGLVVDADTFVKSFQMWRSVQSYFVTGLMQDGGKHGRH